jgi:hypothetical protein
MKITRNSRITASRHQLSSPVDFPDGGATVIAGLRAGHYYEVNEVGARVWQLVQTPIAAADVERAIATEYEVASERCAADVFALLSQLADERLIEVDNAPLP